MKTESGAVGRWVREFARPERLRVAVATVGVLLLAAIGSVVLVAEGSTGGANAVPLTDLRREAVTAAARACPGLTPARLAGQIMATTGFEPTAEGGVGGLTATEWEVWKPWDNASPSDEVASITAVAHLTCDLIGRLRRDGFIGDQWRLAIAAFASSLDQVRTVAGVPDDSLGFVDQVETYSAWYAEQLPSPTPATGTPTTTAPASPSVAPTDATPSPTVSETASASPTATPGPTLAPVTSYVPAPLALNYPSFGDASGLHLNGSAKVSDGRIILTNALQQAGSAWSRTTLDPSKSFSSFFIVNINMPTDGVAFVLQGEGSSALGASGGGLGYGSRPNSDPADRIYPSVAVEIDTWNNTPDGFDPGNVDQHIALTQNGDVTRHLIWGDPGFDMRNNQPFAVWVTYDAGARALSVYASRTSVKPAQPLFVHTINLANHFGGNRAYLGFTGGTGLTNLTESSESILSWSATSD